MTYNFDPDRWYDNERDALERAHRMRQLDRSAYEAALERLQQKLDDLWDRLDGSYQLPGSKEG
jgi:hypothetical protein